MIETIGYVSEANPFKDRKAWSGLRYKIREAIENAGFSVVWIPYRVNKYWVLILRALFLIRYGRHFEYTRHPWYLWYCAKSVDKDLVEKCDALFFPGMAQLTAFLNTDKPFFYYTDATYHGLVTYYGTQINKYSYKFGNLYEKFAIDNCKLMIHASNWSADMAENFYGCNHEKNKVLQFGANIDDTDIVECVVYEKGELNILFSGVDWYRKGAPQAIEAVGELRKRGYNAKLHICGIKCPPQNYLPFPDYVINHGFLNKNDALQYQEYINIIKKSHIFLLPTKAECAGIVFSEASAYGLPIFTYNTGGIGDYVKDGVNGYKLPLGSPGENFANIIDRCIKRNELKHLSEGGIELFKTDLSWNAWSEKFKSMLVDV